MMLLLHIRKLSVHACLSRKYAVALRRLRKGLGVNSDEGLGLRRVAKVGVWGTQSHCSSINRFESVAGLVTAS